MGNGIKMRGRSMRVYRAWRGISIGARRIIRVTLLGAIALIHSSGGLADESAGDVPEKQALPPVKSSKGVYYPDSAKRAGLEGKVLVAFDIVKDGRVVNLSIIFSDDGVFENSVKEYMSGLRFDVPSDWATSQSHYERYHIGFVFCIPPSSLVETSGIAASPVTISTNRISGSAIRNPPAAGATGPCISSQTAKH
jgi:TonB family protein